MIIKNRVVFWIILLFILLSNFTYAASDSKDSFDITLKWLNTTLYENNWNYNVDEISLGILALKTKNYNVDLGVEKLLSLKRADGSFNSNIQETSFAIVALNMAGKKDEIKDSIAWLLDQQQKASLGGNWLLQILASNDGTCDVSMQGQSSTVTFVVNASGANCDYDNNGDNFGSWIDLERPDCGGFNIGKNDTLEINCNNLGRFDSSLIYRFDNNYYIMGDKSNQQRRTTFDIENTYYGNYDDTLYATWALNEVGKSSSVYTLPYLSTNFRESVILDRAILYLISEKTSYVAYLKEVQNNLSGSFDRNVFVTSYSILALKREGSSKSSIDLAVEWLDNERILRVDNKDYGSFDSSVRDTALALYSIYSTSRVGTTSTTGNGNFGSAYCGDFVLNSNEQCDASYFANGSISKGEADNCKGKEKCVKAGLVSECTCKIPSETTIVKNETNVTPKPECTSDDDCGLGSQCNSDGNCEAIIGYCDSDEQCSDKEKCDLDTNLCVEKGANYWWLISIALLLIAGGIVFFLSKKKINFKLKKAEPQKNNNSILTRPQVNIPQRRTGPIMSPPPKNYHDENLERELDRSISKAKELLKKKDKPQ